MAKQPRLMRKVKIDGSWLMLPVAKVPGRDGELRHDLAKVVYKKQPVVVLSGTFYLEYQDGGKKRRAIGDHPREVKAALATQASVLDLRAKGVTADDAPQIRPRSTPAGRTIREVVDGIIASPPIEYRHKTFLKYRNALQTFQAWTKKTHVSQIDRDDVKAFLLMMVLEQGLDPSTAKDKGVILVKVMRDLGAPIAMKKGDWPRITERQVEIYRPELLKQVFAAADLDEYALFQTFLLTGMREREVAFLAWTDFDATRRTLKVTKKTGFDPKNYMERTVPIPPLLVELLVAHRKRQKEKGDQVLIFPTSGFRAHQGVGGGQADKHILRKLKALGMRAGLNCGRCVGRVKNKRVTCATAPVCTRFGLHRFRHTYATTLLQDGVDIVSVQKLLGHKDLDSTKRYLRGLEPEELAAKIDLTSLATKFV